MTVVEYLTKKGFSYNIRGKELQMNCPFCEDKERKFFINAETGAYKCFHENRCGERGGFFQLQAKLGDKPKVTASDKHFVNKKKKYELPKKPERVNNPNEKFLTWFKNRGIKSSIVSQYNIKIQDSKWIVFPYIKNDLVVNRKYRTIDKKFRQEANAEQCLFGQQHIPDEAQELIICEGEIDCLTWRQFGYDCVSIPSGVSNLEWIENDFDFLKRFNKIYLSMDMDEAGRDAVEKIVPRLGKWRCYNLILPYKDVNECLVNGVDDEKIANCFYNAEDFEMPHLHSADYFIEDVKELYLHPEQLEGDPIGFDKLQGILHGWRGGELTIWTGKNGSGKSTFVNQAILKQIVNNGKRICIGSFELPAKRFLNWLIKAYTPIDVEYNQEKVIEDFLKQIAPQLYIIDIVGEVKKDSLYEIMKYAAMKYGVEYFVIDSMMRISMPYHNELKEQKAFISELKSFSMEYDVHTHLITHPRKTQRDDDMIGQADISGTGNITDLADNVIVLHRYSEKQKKKLKEETNISADARIIVTKNREHGEQGGGYLHFDSERKRFSEVVHI